jgi:hypothetical protein
MGMSNNCGPREYANLTQEVRTCFEKGARQRAELTWQGDNESGEVVYRKGPIVVVTQYHYDPDAQVLRLEITDKPAAAKCDRIFEELLDGLKQCGYQP